MNRKTRRALQSHRNSTQHAITRDLPEKLTPVPPDEFPPLASVPDQAWLSRYYLVQLYHEANPTYPGLIRLSICRTKRIGSRWQDGLTWDELQSIKREVGYGDCYAVEVYPRDADLIDVANIRHLWVLPKPLTIGWFE
jgi:hypothetical protein